jgi:hypothetical protein
VKDQKLGTEVENREDWMRSINPSAWRHLIPGQYCAVGGFSTWVFKFEPESAKHFKYV